MKYIVLFLFLIGSIQGQPTLANSDDITAAKDRANHTGTQDWDTLTGTPTTLAGYGITDAAPTPASVAAAIAEEPATIREAADASQKYVTMTVLDLPTYTKTNDTLHPSLLFLSEPFAGNQYWLAHTPYHGANPLEYPVVCASQDGINWHVPHGMKSPIVDRTITSIYPGGKWGHLADTELIEVPANGGEPRKLRCYWIASNDTNATCLMAAETADGVNWTELGPHGDGYLFEVVGLNLGSPSIILDSGTYYLYGNRSDRAMTRWDSVDGITWANPVTLTLPAGSHIWHSQVTKNGSTWHMLGLKSPAGTINPDNIGLIHLSSSDGLVFTSALNNLDGTPAFIHGPASLEPRGFAGLSYYRASMIPRDDGLWDMVTTIFFGNGTGDGTGNGNIAGLGVGSRIAYARGVDIDRVNKWDWRVQKDHRSLLKKLGEPLIDFAENSRESVSQLPTEKGWHFVYATPVAGLAAGSSARLTTGHYNFTVKSNAALQRVIGGFEGFGTLNNLPVYAKIVTGTSPNNPVVIETPADKFKHGGWKIFFIRTQIKDKTIPFLPAVQEGDTITIHGAGDALLLTGKLNGMEQIISEPNHYQEIYLKELSGTGGTPLAVGNTIKVNGANMTHDGANVTLQAVAYPPTPGAVNMMFCPKFTTGADGGFMELFNYTTGVFHGRIEYTSVR